MCGDSFGDRCHIRKDPDGREGVPESGDELIPRFSIRTAAASGVHRHHVERHPDIEARTLGLSIATFRYIPPDLRVDAQAHADYLNKLNTALLTRIQATGEAFVSNAVIDGAFFLRACIVNFRTTAADVAALPEIVARLGAEVDGGMRR